MNNPLSVAVQAGVVKKRVFRMLGANVNQEGLLPEIRESIHKCAHTLEDTQHVALSEFLSTTKDTSESVAHKLISAFSL